MRTNPIFLLGVCIGGLFATLLLVGHRKDREWCDHVYSIIEAPTHAPGMCLHADDVDQGTLKWRNCK